LREILPLRRGEYATGVSDLTRSPWLRAALLIGAVGLAGYGLVSQWPQVHAALGQLDGWDVAGAAAVRDRRARLHDAGLAGAAGRPRLAAAAARGDPGDVRRAAGQVRAGRGVGGAAQVELARDYAVPRRRSATASLVSMAVTLVVGLVAAGVTLPLVSAHAVRQYWWVLAVTPAGGVCLYPPVIKFGLDRVLRVLGRAPLEGSVGRGGMARALGWTTLGWLCYGAHAWFLISVFAGKSGHTFALSLGAYALAWAVGFLIIFFPGGIGPREVALIAVLAPVMPSASALVVALVSRVVMTVGDLAWAGAGPGHRPGWARR
jgi:hypothetical protein